MRALGLVPRSTVEIRRARRVRRITAIAAAVVAALVGLVFGVPHAMVAIGSRRLTACFASYAEPRAGRPSCADDVQWLVFPSRLPWMPMARYRGEEALARIALQNHLDAAIGHPDRAALDAATNALATSETAVHKGSERLVLEELGPAVEAPDVGSRADFVGDRRTLIARSRSWLRWTVRRRAIAAALLEDGAEGAVDLARAYAGWDPSDEDLRVPVAALLCLDGEGKRGLGMLESVQNDRARKRYAAMARNWGDVRALIVACAAAAGVDPPPKPEGGDAGTGEPLVPRAILRIRLGVAASEAQPSSRPVADERKHAIDAAIAILDDPPHARSTRLALLASILDAARPTTTDLLRLAGARQGDLAERPLAPPHALTAFDILDEPPEFRIVVHASTWTRAAERMGEAARSLPESDGRARLRGAAAALWIEAAAAWAREGDAERASGAVDEAAPLAAWSPAATALARSSARYVVGDRARALTELDPVTADPGAKAASPAERRIVAEALVQRAELLASLGRGDEAATTAVRADAEAAAADSVIVDARARFTRLALARPGERLREPPPAPADLRGGRYAWLGFADRSARWTDGAIVGSALPQRLILWSAALDAGAEERLAFRYRALEQRGDAPPWTVPALVAAAKLADGSSEVVEMWLDAFFAIDDERITLRAYAWSRAEAARWRGDAEAAARWSTRYDALRAIARDPARAELATSLGI